ncbi:MAG: hypothetical protein HY673_27355 [Chloroflexi bacterium]|nr:hypothetical protein [Chloroflexota bacterium]
MLDGIAIEAAGKPTAICVGSEFIEEANARKRTMGMSALELVIIPAPLGPTQEARKKAETALPEIVKVLLDGSKKSPEMESAAASGRTEVAVLEKVEVSDSFDSALDAIEQCYAKGWTDGLPVVPPTPPRVRAMLDTVDRDPKENLGKMPPREGNATIEKIAVNAVMAGCLPEYFPVVLAAVEAMMQPQFNLHWVQLSTGSQCPLVIINGPIAKELGVNSGTNVFGSGFRANSAIGRAVRLVCWNVGGAVPDIGRKAVLGYPGEFSHCIAERDDTPWEPLHVERGFAREDSCVTVMPASAYEAMDTILSRIAARMAAFNNYLSVGNKLFLVVLSPQTAWTLSKQGWSKEDVRQYLWHSARVPSAEVLNRGGSVRGVGSKGDDTFIANRGSFEGRWPKWVDLTNPETQVPVASSPQDISIIVAGGTAFGWTALVEATKHSFPVTRRIERKDARGRPVSAGTEEAESNIRSRLERFVENSPYRFNSHRELVSSVIEGLAQNELKYGLAYCTCRVPTGVPAEDRRIICPCEDLPQQIERFGHCDCGLFVKANP